MNNTLIRVNDKARPSDVAGSIAHAIRNDDHAPGECVATQSIGMSATYNALKAAILAQQFLNEDGLTFLINPRYVAVQIEGEERTAIRLEFVVRRERERTDDRQ